MLIFIFTDDDVFYVTVDVFSYITKIAVMVHSLNSIAIAPNPVYN